VYEHIIDMELDHVIVMEYRDRAGTACSGSDPNGIICLDEQEMAYADRVAENNMISGWRTSEISSVWKPSGSSTR
jgi:hypothetical protein